MPDNRINDISNMELNEHNKQEFPPMHTANVDTSQSVSYNQGYAIRAIAIIMIGFVHSINEYACYYSNISSLLLLPMFGMLGCSLFFFMSGYGMFKSLIKNSGSLTISYIYSHIKKILIPVAIVYIINSIVLPWTSTYNDININHCNLLTLSLPEGTGLWFIKIILYDYVTTFLVFKFIVDMNKRLMSILIIQLVLIMVLWICGFGSYWFVSNLGFVLGAWYVFNPFSKKIMVIPISIFVIYYLCVVNGILYVPIQIIGGLVFCIIVVSVIKKLHIFLGG